MKNRLYIIIYILVALLMPQHIEAQDNNALRQIYLQAEEEYQVGRLEQALQLLQTNINGFDGNLKQSAYRLIALCYMAQDNSTQSENYAKLLLQENPYYTSIQDPIRFEELINRLKTGQSATITTASNQAERIEEAPVPVTLITEDMIKMSGARNLKELLIAFVPGMTNVECNEEMNIAMRGIYSSGQEKILIMMDGHRLNSYATNVARPDYSISLEKVKQVEVLRGPASSLYGGVALTAVINIITKRGNDIDGFRVKGGIGNYGQIQGDLLFGQHYLNFDVTAWANFYQADGEKRNIPLESQLGVIPMEGDIIIGGFNKKPTYDFGTRISWKSLSLMYSSNFSKTVAPYSLSYFFAPYDYSKYGLMDGNAPGYASTAHHVHLNYKKTFGKLSMDASITYDAEQQNRYQVISDYFPAEELGYVLIPNGYEAEIYPTEYTFQYCSWLEQNCGVSVNGNLPYRLNGDHNGTISFGAQYNYFELMSSRNLEGDMGDRVLVEFHGTKNLFPGIENSADAYFQLKHQWKSFILNGGLRYDYKRRKNKKSIHELSPRIALVFVQPQYNVKLSYSKAFVDAPYYYRYNTLDTYSGGEELLSEYLHSFQLSISSTKLMKGLEVELNSFYNKASNLIYPDGLVYTNSGTLQSIGAELVAKYTHNRLTTTINAEWQHVVSSENYTANSHSIYNIPNFATSILASYRLGYGFNIRGNLNVLSKQTWLYQQAPEMGIEPEERTLPSRAVFSMGLDYKYKALEVFFDCHNVFNKKYEQGGSSIGPIAQQGRWIKLQVAYKF